MKPRSMPEFPEHLRDYVEVFGKCSKTDLPKAVEAAKANVSEERLRALLEWYVWFSRDYQKEVRLNVWMDRKQGQDFIEQSGSDADPHEVVLAMTQVLDELRRPPFRSLLLESMRSPHPQVRGVACELAGREAEETKDPALVQAVIEALSDPQVALVAQSALSQVGTPRTGSASTTGSTRTWPLGISSS